MPRHADHDIRRSEIIQAVWQVIATAGLPAVSMRAVASAAGVSVGRIQHYFPSKDALVHAACAAMVEGAEQWFAETAPTDVRDNLRALLVHSLAGAGQPGARVWYAFLAASPADPAIAATINEAKAGAEREVGGLLDHLGADPARARPLLALADGLAERVLAGSLDSESAERVIDDELARVV